MYELIKSLSERGQRALFWCFLLLIISLVGACIGFAAPTYSDVWFYRYGFLGGAGFAVFMLILLFIKALGDSHSSSQR